MATNYHALEGDGTTNSTFASRDIGGAKHPVGLGINSSGYTVRPTITVSASPDYAAGDCVGGIITLSGVMLENGRSAELRSLMVKDASGQAPALTLMFFRATPSGGTYTDNAAFVWGTNDLANLVKPLDVLSANYKTVAGKSFADLSDIGQVHDATAKDLFLLILIPAGGSWNAAATTDLMVELQYERR